MYPDEPQTRLDIVEVGRRLWMQGFVASNDGNISVRLGPDRLLTTPKNVSKGFMTPDMMVVTDMQGLVQMRAFAPVCFDATHAVQFPGANGGSSGGDRRAVAPLSRAAVAAGIDALFIETHPDPEHAPCDGPSQISFEELDRLLAEVRAIDSALRNLAPAR